MSTNQWRVAGTVFCYLVVFLSGFRLSRSGKPYNGALFNVHKLIALAGVVLFAIALNRANRVATLSGIEWIVAALAGLLFLALFATGGLLSIDRPMPVVVTRLHHIMPYLAVLSTAVALNLLVGGK